MFIRFIKLALRIGASERRRNVAKIASLERAIAKERRISLRLRGNLNDTQRRFKEALISEDAAWHQILDRLENENRRLLVRLAEFNPETVWH